MVRLKLNKLSLSKILTFSLIFFFTISNCDSKSDFSALLAFKSTVDTSNSLSSWSINSSNSNEPCRAWLGVTCHPRTRRVIKLVLNHLNLTGSAHELTRLSHLRHLSLHHNHLSLLPNFTSMLNLKHIYLSNNRFSGEFPPGIRRLMRLRRLDASYNNFSGEIPMTELTQLPHLLTLRLEFNSFSGSLGPEKTPSSSFSDFNVSGNDLTGKIPNWLSQFSVSAFSGNVKLCGYPLPSGCPSDPVSSDPTAMINSPGNNQRMRKLMKDDMLLLIMIVDGVAVMVTVMIVIWCCYYRKKKKKNQEKENKIVKNKFDQDNYSSSSIYHSFEFGGVTTRDHKEMLVCFEGCKGFAKVDDLLRASAEMLGKGVVGTAYKVAVDGGDVVVVKRVRDKLKKKKDLDELLRVVGELRHTNVVCLRAYYFSKEELLLVFDFLPNGSLHNLLHGNRGPGRTPLDWKRRLKYALGTARGLSFIHNHNKSKLCHGHLTSSNILIDHNDNACISDIALHLLLIQLPSSSNDEKSIQNNVISKNISIKSDVYSFGLILLEILTGKVATSSEGEVNLASWVKRVVMNKEWTWDVFDFELGRYKEMEDEMVSLLQVAMACLAENPKDRPKMVMVVKMIEDIWNRGRKTEYVVADNLISS